MNLVYEVRVGLCYNLVRNENTYYQNGNSFRNDYICWLYNSIIFKTISVVLSCNILLVAVEKLKKTNFTYLVYCNTGL